ncbi:MAG: formylglycine-generating enzyme family protein [Nannocystaceae bacterium]|nr:formylglycine-generating enzyme family protein [Nannocystaceae bacterium]
MTPEMIRIAAGDLVLRDEGTQSTWEVAVSTFRLASHPVTRALYETIAGGAPTSCAGPQTPVTEVSWIDAVRFCNALSAQAGLDCCYVLGEHPDAEDVVWDRDADGYRLPTEAEWEHACRAGSTEPRYGTLEEIAWFRGNSGKVIHDVATRVPNAWGLHDTIGNTWEWCWDLFDPRRYGPYRVFRGGGWFDHPRGCRASCRRKSHPTLCIDDLGIRVARSG